MRRPNPDYFGATISFSSVICSGDSQRVVLSLVSAVTASTAGDTPMAIRYWPKVAATWKAMRSALLMTGSAAATPCFWIRPRISRTIGSDRANYQETARDIEEYLNVILDEMKV